MHKLYANYEVMTSITLFRVPLGRIKQFCVFLSTLLLEWLCGKLGMKPVAADAELLPRGCRAIPAGHFNLDPDMVAFFGGKEAHDAINKAIIYQRFAARIESNRRAGRNMRDGQAYSYNTYDQWAAEIHIFHPKTIQKHVRAFEALGLLSSEQPWKHEGKCVKHYTSPLRLTDNPEQMLLWSEHKTPRVGALDSDDSTMHYPTTHQPAIRNAKTTAASARARKPVNAAAVADFPNHIPDVEPPEKKTQIPEARLESDEHEQFTAIAGTPTIPGVYPPPPVPRSPSPTGDKPTEEETRSSGATPEIAVPGWMPDFFTGCTEDELMHLLHQFGEETLNAARKYAENPDNHIENPPGYVRAQLAKGWRPPAGQGIRFDNTDGRAYITGKFADFIEH